MLKTCAWITKRIWVLNFLFSLPHMVPLNALVVSEQTQTPLKHVSPTSEVQFAAFIESREREREIEKFN